MLPSVEIEKTENGWIVTYQYMALTSSTRVYEKWEKLVEEIGRVLR